MPKLKIALCDKDDFYRRRFSEYMIRHKAQETELFTYSSAEEFFYAAEKEDFQLVVAGDSFESAFKEKNTVKVLFLKEEYESMAADAAAWETEPSAGTNSISKYQPMEQILHEIYILTGKERAEKKRFTLAGGLEVIGVCSPSKHEMQGLFSMLYAVEMSKSRRVLYISFLEFFGFKDLFGQSGDQDVGDVLLKIRGGCLSTEYFWRCVYEMSGISVLYPFENPENIAQIGEQELSGLIGFLEKNTEFELIVIDFGVSMQDLAACMELCTAVFLIGREEFFFRSQEQAFREWVNRRGSEGLSEKLQTVFIAYTAKYIKGGGNTIEQLQWSEFGDFVRKYAGHSEKGGGFHEDNG